MKTLLAIASAVFVCGAGCTTCPNPYDNCGPVVSPGYPAASYSTQPQYGQPQPQYGQAQPGYGGQQPVYVNSQPGGTPTPAIQNNIAAGQPTPANTARLAPVETPSTQLK